MTDGNFVSLCTRAGAVARYYLTDGSCAALNCAVIINACIQRRQQLNSNWIAIEPDSSNLGVHVNNIQLPYDRSRRWMPPSLSFNIDVLNELTNAIYLIHPQPERNDGRDDERGYRNNRRSRVAQETCLPWDSLFSRSPHASADGRIAIIIAYCTTWKY